MRTVVYLRAEGMQATSVTITIVSDLNDFALEGGFDEFMGSVHEAVRCTKVENLSLTFSLNNYKIGCTVCGVIHCTDTNIDVHRLRLSVDEYIASQLCWLNAKYELYVAYRAAILGMHKLSVGQ